MDWFTLPAAVLVFLCLKLILDRLEYGFQGWHYDPTGRDDNLRPQD